jgi:hypothetical protein
MLMKKMLNEGNQIDNFIASSGSGTGQVSNYGSGSGFVFLTNSGSGSASKKIKVPTVLVSQYCPFHVFKSGLREGPGSSGSRPAPPAAWTSSAYPSSHRHHSSNNSTSPSRPPPYNSRWPRCAPSWRPCNSSDKYSSSNSSSTTSWRGEGGRHRSNSRSRLRRDPPRQIRSGRRVQGPRRTAS